MRADEASPAGLNPADAPFCDSFVQGATARRRVADGHSLYGNDSGIRGGGFESQTSLKE